MKSKFFFFGAVIFFLFSLFVFFIAFGNPGFFGVVTKTVGVVAVNQVEQRNLNPQVVRVADPVAITSAVENFVV